MTIADLVAELSKYDYRSLVYVDTLDGPIKIKKVLADGCTDGETNHIVVLYTCAKLNLVDTESFEAVVLGKKEY